MSIKSIEIKGFKSIRDLSIDLHPINILIGPNGVGKSNFVKMFRMLNYIMDKELQSYVRQSGGADKLLYFGSNETEKIKITIRINDNEYMCILRPESGDTLYFHHESCKFYGDYTDKTIPIGEISGYETGLLDSMGPIASHTRQYMSGFKVFHFHDTSTSAKVKKTCKISDNRRLRQDASNLAAVLYRAKRSTSDSYHKILEIVQRIAPFIQDFDLEPEPDNEETIRLLWKHSGTDAYFDANDLSDGTLRFICLATLFMQPLVPDTILLDEPELGLHPHAIHLLAGIMEKVSKRKQIIASTQSVTLANQFSFEDVIVVDRKEGESLFHRYKEEEYQQWSEEYGLGDLWEKNLLGGNP